MHVGGQPHFGNDSDASTGNADAIGLFEGQLKMRGFDRVCYFLAQFREKFRNNAISGKPLSVFCLEKLFSNDPVSIDEKISGAGKAFLHTAGFRVEDPISLDGLGVRVREHWVFELVSVSKIFQDFFRVIADGRQLDALLFESRDGALQLDQLPFAERSPVGGTEKEKNGAVPSFQGIESLYATKLVTKRKGGSSLTDRDPNRHQLDGSDPNGIVIESSPDGHRVS